MRAMPKGRPGEPLRIPLERQRLDLWPVLSGHATAQLPSRVVLQEHGEWVAHRQRCASVAVPHVSSSRNTLRAAATRPPVRPGVEPLRPRLVATIAGPIGSLQSAGHPFRKSFTTAHAANPDAPVDRSRQTEVGPPQVGPRGPDSGTWRYGARTYRTELAGMRVRVSVLPMPLVKFISEIVMYEPDTPVTQAT